MRLGVTMRVVETASYKEPRDAISHDFVRWLGTLGHTPVLIPNTLTSAAAYADDLGIEGIVLTSGNDVAEDAERRGDVSIERDRTEFDLVKLAESKRLPLFGVCRGLHVLNLYFGGSVVGSIKTQIARPANHVAAQHDVDLDGPFGQIAGASRIVTNSFHNQGVCLEGLGAGLTAFARCSEDGLVEGIVHRELPFVAIQWHPERPNPATGFDRAIVQKLFAGQAF